MSTGRPAARKHLMNLDDPRPRRSDPMSLTRVQRWVMSSLAATTILHMSLGLVIAAAFAERRDAQIGLLVIATAFGVLAFAAALVIHQRRLLSPWLLLGPLPSLAGAYFVF
jgi:uncharacterized membrane protein